MLTTPAVHSIDQSELQYVHMRCRPSGVTETMVIWVKLHLVSLGRCSVARSLSAFIDGLPDRRRQIARRAAVAKLARRQ